MLNGTRLGVRRVLSNRAAGPLRSYVRFQSTSASTSKDGWELVVGLEIHAQLKTGRKLFSGELCEWDVLADISRPNII